MSEFGNRLAQAQVQVTSPSEVIRLDGDGRGNLAVAISHGSLRGWTETALEQETAAVVDAALLAARRTYLQIHREVFARGQSWHRADGTDDRDPAGDGRPPDPGPIGTHSRIEIFQSTMEEFEVRGSSERGYVTVVRDQEHRFHVRIRPGTLRYLREPELAEEIRSALTATLASYREGQEQAYRHAYGSLPGAR